MSNNYCKSNQCTLYLTNFTHISGNIAKINPVWAQTKHLKAHTTTQKRPYYYFQYKQGFTDLLAKPVDISTWTYCEITVDI